MALRAIVLAAEHLAGFGGLDVLLELVEAFQRIAVDAARQPAPTRRARRDRRRGCFSVLLERDLLVEPPAALQKLLRLGLVLPEVGLGDTGLDAIELGT